LFYPEKRPFFLENASTFQFGQPQQIDLFFSRRIGLSAAGLPIDIRGGGRLSGKVAGWNVGMLDIQVDDVENATGQIIGAANNFGVIRMQREIGRSSYGAIFVNRQGTGPHSNGDDYNRAYGLDANVQVSQSQRVSAFFARIPLNPALWTRLKAFAATPAAAALTGIHRRYVDETVEEFRQAGADLPEAQRTRLEALQTELAEVTQKYGENVLDATNAWELIVTDEARLRGLPEHAVAAAKRSAEGKGFGSPEKPANEGTNRDDGAGCRQ